MGNNYPTKNLLFTVINIYSLFQSKLKTNIAIINYAIYFFDQLLLSLFEKLYFTLLSQSLLNVYTKFLNASDE